jgi:hypothetical protein
MEFSPLGTGRRDMLILGKEKHLPKRDKQLLCRGSGPVPGAASGCQDPTGRRRAKPKKAPALEVARPFAAPFFGAKRFFDAAPFCGAFAIHSQTNKALLLREKSPS